MIELMRNGGFPMWFILAFGVMALGGAARWAIRPDAQRVGFVRNMARATLYATLAGTAAALGSVFIHFAGNPEWQSDPKWHVIIIQGLGESMSPGIVGFALLACTAFVCAVAESRRPVA